MPAIRRTIRTPPAEMCVAHLGRRDTGSRAGWRRRRTSTDGAVTATLVREAPPKLSAEPAPAGSEVAGRDERGDGPGDRVSELHAAPPKVVHPRLDLGRSEDGALGMEDPVDVLGVAARAGRRGEPVRDEPEVEIDR